MNNDRPLFEYHDEIHEADMSLFCFDSLQTWTLNWNEGGHCRAIQTVFEQLDRTSTDDEHLQRMVSEAIRLDSDTRPLITGFIRSQYNCSIGEKVDNDQLLQDVAGLFGAYRIFASSEAMKEVRNENPAFYKLLVGHMPKRRVDSLTVQADCLFFQFNVGRRVY